MTTRPDFPAHVLSVAEWRLRCRGIARDAPLPAIEGIEVDPSLATVLSDDDIDGALRAALSALTVWRPATRLLTLALVAGQSVYPLPADFADPVDESWACLLGTGTTYGNQPGARYALLRRQALLDNPLPLQTRGTTGTGFGYGSSWGGRLYDGSLPLLPQDSHGNLNSSNGFGGRQAAFYPASFDAPLPVLVLTPAPTQSVSLPPLDYRAAHLPRRLTLDTNTGDWQVDTGGALVYSVAPLGAAFHDDTDLLPFATSDDAIRLSYLYASAWLLSERLLSLADTDGEKWSFYELKTGMGRRDVQALADAKMREFNERTKNVGHGRKG